MFFVDPHVVNCNVLVFNDGFMASWAGNKLSLWWGCMPKIWIYGCIF